MGENNFIKTKKTDTNIRLYRVYLNTPISYTVTYSCINIRPTKKKRSSNNAILKTAIYSYRKLYLYIF